MFDHTPTCMLICFIIGGIHAAKYQPYLKMLIILFDYAVLDLRFRIVVTCIKHRQVSTRWLDSFVFVHFVVALLQFRGLIKSVILILWRSGSLSTQLVLLMWELIVLSTGEFLCARNSEKIFYLFEWVNSVFFIFQCL